jgi:hypothetical protein
LSTGAWQPAPVVFTALNDGTAQVTPQHCTEAGWFMHRAWATRHIPGECTQQPPCALGVQQRHRQPQIQAQAPQTDADAQIFSSVFGL